MQNRHTLTGGRDSQHTLQQCDLVRDLRERVPIEVAWVKDLVEVADVIPTGLLRRSASSKTWGVKGAAYDNKVIKVPKIAFLVKLLVYREEFLERFHS